MTTAMFEFIILLVGTVPFLVGMYAIRLMKKSNDKGSDDPPPPPDPIPPLPVLPPSPEPCRLHHHLPVRHSRGPATHMQVAAPRWGHRIHC